MIKETFRKYIADEDFKGMFNALGWNRYQGLSEFDEDIDGISYHFCIVGQIKGFQAIVCTNAPHMTSSLCKRIDYKLRPSAQSYICIFTLPKEQGQKFHHMWAIPIRKPEKRDIVLIEYTTPDQTDLLFQKHSGITFGVNEQNAITISDVRERIYNAFEVNSEKLTKDFYTGFRKQHTAFCEFITGIEDQIAIAKNRNKQWYASVMLNRLMFCYFIQKKGFLDGDYHYLRNKLAWCNMQRGTGHFYSFYRSFLLQLFHGGLNSPRHNSEFEAEFGRIPYLNGGMFDVHQLEKDYADIDIKDEAFEKLFAFFDQWEWHLDTRMTASGRDINPDVLGYIFEQYINDRAQMGAYYTKEDITEYIGKNCILPFLMDKLKAQSPDAFKPDGYVWTKLRESGDKYIYDAVKKGIDHFDEIPEDIARGIDTSKPNLLERRANWNDRTPDPWALPTEIWRETIERLQRCQDIQRKIANGEITEINDFITYNLDIRQFVQDLLEDTKDHLLLLHFMKALTSVSILDPTCGSGAFLFAAMNILEPLYEACVNGMRKFNEEDPNLFKENLAELDTKYRSNVQYFIYKTIILNNLYGVDIMHEAVEIAKLRLFLKMVAVVDVDMRADNLGLDPLPDIDFNIRCGNTLVGYATEEQLNNDLSYGDMFANLEFKDKIETEMQKVSKTFDRFRKLQLTQSPDDLQAFKDAKKELNDRLAALNDLLNHKMYQQITAGGQSYDSWLALHQPFHWLAEYYNIIHGNGGFDVIIGNPPYVEYNKKVDGVAISDIYKLRDYKTLTCGNLYAHCIERSHCILNGKSTFGMVVPLSLTCGNRMDILRSYITSNFNANYFANFEIFPSKLFDGAFQRVTIFLSNNLQKEKISKITKLNRWYSIERTHLFSRIRFTEANLIKDDIGIAKFHTEKYSSVLRRICQYRPLGTFVSNQSSNKFIYYQEATNYWMKAAMRIPYYCKNGEITEPAHGRKMYFRDKKHMEEIFCLINSSLFFLWYTAFSDGFHLSDNVMKKFPIDSNLLDNDDLYKLSSALAKDINKNSYRTTRNTRTDDIVIESFRINASKLIIDEIDKVLAKHYGFTEEELDFIINYDIKYRMGDELNDE